MLVWFAVVSIAYIETVAAPRTVAQPSSAKGSGPNAMQQAYAKLQMSMKDSCNAAEATLKANPTLGHRTPALPVRC